MPSQLEKIHIFVNTKRSSRLNKYISYLQIVISYRYLFLNKKLVKERNENESESENEQDMRTNRLRIGVKIIHEAKVQYDKDKNVVIKKSSCRDF